MLPFPELHDCADAWIAFLIASVAEFRTEAERLQSQLDRLLSGSFSSQISSGSVELLELRSELLEIKSDYLEKLVNDE